MSNIDIMKKIDITNKTALITGASRGLGRRFSCVLSNMGANVVLAARDKDKLLETEEMIKNSNGETINAGANSNALVIQKWAARPHIPIIITQINSNPLG